MRIRNHKAWTADELQRLAAIVASGGSALRAAAALKRNLISCKNQARKLGTPFTPLWLVRKNVRARCDAVDKGLRR